MIVYRFTHERFKDDISGTGAKLFGGRWNEVGLPAIYSSSSISLSLLEVLVNAQILEELKSLQLMKLNIANPFETSIQKLKNLKENWLTDFDYTKWIGSQFLKENELLLLETPSAVISEEMNYMINPLHKDFKRVKMISSEAYVFDERLFKI
jgi:RES domain-containing protein